MKLLALVAVPPAVVTVIGPLAGAGGHGGGDLGGRVDGVDVAAAPLKATAVAPVRSVPVIVTAVPTGRPLLGLKLR